jgi:hypothetical protein
MSSSTLHGQLFLDSIRDIAGFRARSVTMTSEVESGFVPSSCRSVVMTGSRLESRSQTSGPRAKVWFVLRRFFPRCVLVLELLRSRDAMGLR